VGRTRHRAAYWMWGASRAWRASFPTEHTSVRRDRLGESTGRSRTIALSHTTNKTKKGEGFFPARALTAVLEVSARRARLPRRGVVVVGSGGGCGGLLRGGLGVGGLGGTATHGALLVVSRQRKASIEFVTPKIRNDGNSPSLDFGASFLLFRLRSRA
jgi:hypothetical protein